MAELTPAHPTPAQKQVIEDEKAAQARADAAAKAAPKAPLGPWTPDLTDNAYPPSDPRNRGNLDYKPLFAEPEATTKEAPSREPAARDATSLVLSGKGKLPAGTFDNISGSPRFQYPDLQNPLWRWDATGRVTQWVRP